MSAEDFCSFSWVCFFGGGGGGGGGGVGVGGVGGVGGEKIFG